MIPVEYFAVVSFALFAIGLAGVAATRHFVLMIFSIEVALTAATLIATVFFYFNTDGNIMLLLFTIWTIAASEAIALVAFYRYISKYETNMDVAQLSKLRDK
ncbi:MAG: NADH-quinone oxidoreductase subunit K [Candidatus Micrarchaeales archaeon]|nr:NADH-quinone oxidoreductase subunit K [Candidatus Micrarchaeales archaeon]